jgi:hypothetical protein
VKRLVQSQINLYYLEVVERVRQVVGVREWHAAALSVIEQRWLSGFDIVNGPERTVVIVGSKVVGAHPLFPSDKSECLNDNLIRLL